MARSGCLRLIGQRKVTYLVGGCAYAAFLGDGLFKFWLIGARVNKYGQVWMGQTSRAGMGEISSRWLFVCVHVKVLGMGGCGQVWVALGKGVQVYIGQIDQAGMADMSSGWTYMCACSCRGGCR